MFRFFRESAAIRHVETLLDQERLAHAKTRNELAIAKAQIETLSLALARDRARVQAELASFARQRAESEGERGSA